MSQPSGIYNLDDATFVEVIFVSVKKIQILNKTHRNIDTPTDVLSFPLYGFDELRIMNNELWENVPVLLGTLVLCRRLIRQRAKEEGTSFDQRLDWTIKHGLKHLLGYDHDSTGKRWLP